MMFGKPAWFRVPSRGWGLHPVTWQGWGYGAGWIGAMAIPFVSLVARHQGPEAIIWLFALMGLLAWDVAGIRRSLRGMAGSELLYIGDEGECSTIPAAQTRK